MEGRRTNRIQIDVIKRHLELIDPDREKWIFKAFKKGGYADAFSGSLEEAIPHLEKWNSPEYIGTFFQPNASNGTSLHAKEKDIEFATCQFIDVDEGEPPTDWIEKPHIKIQTNPRGYHFYWLTKTISDLDYWSRIQKSLAQQYQSDPKVVDAPRIMRLAGTYNYKDKLEEPFLVQIKGINDLDRYANEDIALPIGEEPILVKETNLNPAIKEYNSQTDVKTYLKKQGYKESTENRFINPDSSSGSAGLVVLGDVVFSHNGSDKLSDNKPHDAFDMKRILEHDNNYDEALADVKGQLGLKEELKEIVFPHERKGRLSNTKDNLKALTDSYGIEVAYDEMKKELEINIPNSKMISSIEDQNKISHVKSLCGQHHLSSSNLIEFLELNARALHPAINWVESKKWDGKSRITDLVEALGSDDMCVREYLIKWSTYAIACLYRQNINSEGMIVLVGTQGLGKGRFFKSLAPDHLIQDSINLDPDNKDSIHTATSSWLVELAELDGITRKADVASLKSFLTKREDRYRMPYAPRDNRYPRRTAYFGTVNEPEFLMDASGNRRFWVIQCDAVNPKHGIDMQQYWAEIKDMFDKGAKWHLSEEAFIYTNENNEKYITKDFFEEAILEAYLGYETWIKPKAMLTATQVAQHLDISNPHPGQLKKIGQAMKALGCEQSTYSKRKVWVVPERLNNEI